jgi:cytochrome c peroxidase
MDTATGKVTAQHPVGEQPKADTIRTGEQIFHDANVCFQHWQSCSTCHPDSRMDGLRWDLLNDGIGNPKKTRSLVLSHQTSPVMAMGVRASLEVGTSAGFKHILFVVVPQSDIEATCDYLRSLKPVPSPHLGPEGKLTEAAERGKKLFDEKAGCAACHSGPILTDMKAYDVGTLGELDRKGNTFYTPKLVELYRTGPFLHDARAATLMEVLTKYNKNDAHGTTSKLSKEELDDLVAYLMSL